MTAAISPPGGASHLREPRSPSDLASVWRAESLAVHEQVRASGHPALDAQLPGGGWPEGALVELLQDRPAQHLWQLLLPALVPALRDRPGPLVLVGAPWVPFGPSLAAQGLPGERLLWVQTEAPAARLWATEQALRCADVVAVLAWLPRCQAAQLRRLHLAARDKLLFVVRPLSVQHDASPARLRLRLEGTDGLQVRIVKRRGPPHDAPLVLPAQPARLAALLAARRRRVGGPAVLPVQPARVVAGEGVHALDRTVAA